jgi:hypothetical protein
MLVTAAKILFEEKVLVGGKKQSPKKTSRLTRQAGQQGSRGCLLCFVLSTLFD